MVSVFMILIVYANNNIISMNIISNNHNYGIIFFKRFFCHLSHLFSNFIIIIEIYKVIENTVNLMHR